MEMEYIGKELALFSNAHNWKSYFAGKVKQFVQGDVLEVGAGLGVNSKYLANPQVVCWHFLEPDERLCKQIGPSVTQGLPQFTVTQGTIENVAGKFFDTVLYIDVLEHIQKSRQELENLQRLVKRGGFLIILVPAYNFLFSEFDRAIGHYRRYDKGILKSEVPAGFTQKKLFYLDSLGVVASVANKLFLHQDNPTLEQVSFWDRTLVPLSKVLDRVVLNSFGKSLIGVYQRNGQQIS